MVMLVLASMLTSGCGKDATKNASPPATVDASAQSRPNNARQVSGSEGVGVGSVRGQIEAPVSGTPQKWIPPHCLPLSNEDPYYQEEDYQFLPGSYENHAQQCHDEGRYAEAITEWKKAIAAAKDAPRNDQFDTLGPHIWLGVDYDKAGFPMKAKVEWNRAISLREQSTLGESKIPFKANALFIAGRYRKSFSAYHDVIYPPTGGAVFNIIWFEDQGSVADLNAGLSEAVAGDYRTAKTSLEKAISLSPELYPAHLLLGNINYMAGDREAAIKEWEATLFSQSPDPPSSISRFYPVHWAAPELLIHYR